MVYNFILSIRYFFFLIFIQDKLTNFVEILIHDHPISLYRFLESSLCCGWRGSLKSPWECRPGEEGRRWSWLQDWSGLVKLKGTVQSPGGQEEVPGHQDTAIVKLAEVDWMAWWL